MITNNIRRYATACNVDAADMVKHLQSDSFARQQFEDWKQENNFVGVEFQDHSNEARKAEADAAKARIAARYA